MAKPRQKGKNMKDIKEITAQLEQGVKGVFESQNYIEYLQFMAKFHHYSVNNSILIWMQNPTASHVAGYQTWLKKFKRQVRKGEKGITILAPCPHKFRKEVTNEDGTVEEVEVAYTSFKPTTVFDISQTDGEAVPTMCDELTGEVSGYDELMAKLKALSPVPVDFEDITNGSHGYYNIEGKFIRVKSGMSEVQTVKTLVHEISHAIMHEKEAGEEKDADRGTKEVQAESVAYTVCAMLGLDTADYSFEYVAGWSAGREVKELVQSMEVIRKTAAEIYEGIKAA